MIYELRQYTIEPGTQDLLHQLFADEIAPLFREVGMETIGFWEPVAGTDAGDVEFVYLLGFTDAADRERAWAEFLSHPKWLQIKVKAGTPAPWKAVVKTILQPLPYSPDATSEAPGGY